MRFPAGDGLSVRRAASWWEMHLSGGHGHLLGPKRRGGMHKGAGMRSVLHACAGTFTFADADLLIVEGYDGPQP
jgi:hypothetical protein